MKPFQMMCIESFNCHSEFDPHHSSERDKTKLQSFSAEIEDCERRTTISAVLINQAFMVE